jgi:hypothetical protein
MTIIEAIELGRPFKRPIHDQLMQVVDNQIVYGSGAVQHVYKIGVEDIMATDWRVSPHRYYPGTQVELQDRETYVLGTDGLFMSLETGRWWSCRKVFVPCSLEDIKSLFNGRKFTIIKEGRKHGTN